MNWNDTAALVTGGSRGLGRALGIELARRGARVVLAARGREALEEAVAAARAVDGGEVHALAADVGDPDAPYCLAAEAAALVGPIDLLVNNASSLGETPLPLLADARVRDVERVFAVNVFGPFRLTKAVVGAMLVRGGGSVVNLSSDAAVEPYPRWGAYGASKAALDHLGAIWAAELADSGVRILSVDPGEMATRMHADAVPEADPGELADPADVAARILEMVAQPGAAPSGARLVAGQWGAAA